MGTKQAKGSGNNGVRARARTQCYEHRAQSSEFCGSGTVGAVASVGSALKHMKQQSRRSTKSNE